MPEGPQAAQVIDSLVRDGNKIIFATSFGYMDAMAAAAKKYPDVYFEHATGYKTVEELRRTTSAPARTRSTSPAWPPAPRRRTATIGYVVPFPIPEVIRHANAFALGAQAMHPDAKVKLVWTKSWFDPAKEKKAAESLARGRRRRDRPERRQPGGRPVRRSRRASRGSATTRDAQEVRADVVAHGRGLRLGPVLPQARQGGA